MAEELQKRIAPVIVYAALFIVIILGIQMMSYIVNILLVSVILTLMLLPALAWLKERGLSDVAAVIILTLGACICLVILAFLILWSLGVVTQGLPQYQAELQQRLTDVASLLGTDIGTAVEKMSSSFDLKDIVQLVSSYAVKIGEALLDIFFIGVTTCFMLLEAPKMPERFARFTEGNPALLGQIRHMSQNIIDFMIVRTETNAVHGILFGSSLWIMGVHAAPVWGLMTFILGYIPYIGLIMAAVPAILFAFIQFGIWGAVAVVVLVCALNLIVENPVFSYLASRRFEIPALIVIFSVIFWGWLLGIPGMFFAVPITLLVLILFQSNEDLRGINVLLGVSHLFEHPGTVPEKTDGTAGSGG